MPSRRFLTLVVVPLLLIAAGGRAHAQSVHREVLPSGLTLVIQVNGKLRGQIEMPASATREEVEAAARVNENVLRFVDGLTIRKVIVVPGKLVNIVAS